MHSKKQNKPLERKNRIFRADTPHDVFCAVITAMRLPKGNDVLLLNADYNEDADFFECMKLAAASHTWKDVIDISGLSIHKHNSKIPSVKNRVFRLFDTVDSIKELRFMIAKSFDISLDAKTIKEELNSKIDEMYLNCFHHPEVRIFYNIFSSAKVIYYPHGFDSLHKAEIEHYKKYIWIEDKNLRNNLVDKLKKFLFGDDAVPMRKARLNASYSLNESFPSLKEQFIIKEDLNSTTMKELFDGLPSNAKDYFSNLASKCKENTILLLLFPEIEVEQYSKQTELEGYVSLLKKVIPLEKAKTILIKPHPRISNRWLTEILHFLDEKLPEINFVVIKDFRYLSIEIVKIPFNVTACTGIASSSMRTLKEIYGIETYYSKKLLPKLMSWDKNNDASDVWIKEVEKDFISLEISV